MGDGCVVTLMAGEDATRRRVDVGPGTSTVVGSCPCPECGAGLVLRTYPGAWVRAAVTVRDDHWELDNLSVDAVAWLVDLEDPASRVSAPPGRRRLVVPFEFAGLSFRVGARETGEHLTVIGTESRLSPETAGCRSSTAPLTGAGLRPGTAYYAVLEELVRGGVTGGDTLTAAALASRLVRRGWRITPKAVEHHIDYVWQRCFPGEVGRGRGWKRTALVSLLQRAQMTVTGHGGAVVKGESVEPPPVPQEAGVVVL